MGVLGYKTLLKVGDGATAETFTTIPGLLGVDGQEETGTTVDVTDADSANNAVEKLGEAIVDPGQITARLNYMPTNATQLSVRTDMFNGTARNFQVVSNNTASDTLAFTGIVTRWAKSSAERGSQHLLEIGIDITGKPTEAT